jgi:hypothetical protein
MSKKKPGFTPHSAEKQKEYEERAAQEYGDTVRQSAKLYASYSDEQKAAIWREAEEIYSALVEAMPLGPASAQVQALLARWHQHLHYFFEPSLEVLRALGENYNQHPEFNATFTALHPDLPPFLQAAINQYVDTLETQWLERELGILKE